MGLVYLPTKLGNLVDICMNISIQIYIEHLGKGMKVLFEHDFPEFHCKG